MVVPDAPSSHKPVVPMTALARSKPTGEILWTIGPAKNRSVNIKTFVQMNARREVVGFANTTFVMSWIQLSVPSST